ncbi:hypothetical protein Tco_1391407 [Tanacetum coccineum]
MSSIAAQQTKLDLELVPKEKRLEIRKCNGRLNPGKKQREPTFQIVVDDLALTSCYSAFLTTIDVPEICPRVHGQNFDELPTDDVIVSFFKELGHTGEIKSITDVVVDQMHQPWRTFATIINRSLSGKTTSLDKLRLSRAQILWVSPEEPTRKSKRVKRPAKKSTNAPTTGVVIRDTHMMSSSKKKEKVTIEKPKGIELLFEVALTEEAQFEEVHKKSMRDFHKTHPSGSGIVTSAAKSNLLDEDDSNNNHDSSSEGNDQESDSGDNNTQSDNEKGSDSEHETDENETGSESDQKENEEEVEDDEEEKDDEFVKTLSNYTDDEYETNVESKIEDKAEGDEYKEMDYTTDQFDDDVDVRLNKPVNTDEGFIQKEGTDAEMINVQQGNENLEVTLNQVIEDAHVTISTIAKKTEVLVTSSSYSSDLASKFLNFLDIPHTDAEIVSPIDVLVHHEVPSNQTPTLLTVPVSVITEYSPIYTTIIPQSLPSFTPPPPQSTPTPPPTTEATNPLSGLPNFTFVFQFNNRVSALEKYVAELKKDDLLNTQVTALILPKEVSNFAPLVIKSMVIESLEHAVLAKESFQSQSTYEVASSLTEFELKKILIDKMDEKELEFEVADSDMPQDQEENLGNDDEEPKRKVASKRDWFTKPKQPEEPTDPIGMLARLHNKDQIKAALSEKLDWDNPKGGGYPFDLTKPLPLVMNGNHQMVPVDYFFNNDLMYLQGGISTMTYTTSTTKTKVAQYDLQGVEDMVPNIWSHVKVAYDKYALWVTRVKVMRKHRYGYLREIEGRRLPKTSTVNVRQKQGYSKASQRSSTGSRKLPEEDQQRNRLMRSDELYKFSDGTLTRLRSSLDDITKNIQMEYLPKRRWSSLEKKRAHIMIKGIDKQLTDRRIMRILEKFVGRRHYETYLRLL